MKWFKHDTDASIDSKLQTLMLDYGAEGYGLYWYCVELIAQGISKDNITFELEHDARIIARNLNLSPQKTQDMMKEMVNLGLFSFSENNKLACYALAKRIDQSMTSNKEFRTLIDAVRSTHEDRSPKSHDEVKIGHDQKSPKSHDGVMTESENVMNRREEKREEEKREEEKREEDIPCTEVIVQDEFEIFWQAYPKKRAKQTAKKAFDKQKPYMPDIESLIEHLEAMKLSQDWLKDNGQFIPYPASWINAHRWNDEINLSDAEKASAIVGNSNMSYKDIQKQRGYDE